MKKVAAFIAALQFLVLGFAAAAEAPASVKECTLCAGAVLPVALASAIAPVPTAPVPLLMRIPQDQLAAAGAQLDALSPQQRRRTTVIVAYSVDATKDALLDVEQHTTTILDWARQHGPFDSIGVAVSGADIATTAYAIKRLSVTAQGLDITNRIVLPQTASDALAKLYDAGAGTYFDTLLVDGPNVAAAAKWLAEKDPSKKVFAVVAPQAPNAFFDLAKALAAGATRAYLDTTVDAATLAALAAFDLALAGDYAYDSTARNTSLDVKGNPVDLPVLTFVRGEDLRTVIVPSGDAAASTIVSMGGDELAAPRRYDAAGETAVTDSGKKGGHFLVGVQKVTGPFALTLDRTEKVDANVTKEAIDVATKRGITVEEIIRNHQSYKAFQDSIQPRYVALDATKLRFSIGDGGEAVEATISGDYFSDPKGGSDWVWKDFFINGVRWKYGRIPELPLIQPEKVTQLPLDIHLTNEYRYSLVRETDVDGYHTYEVRFDPPAHAPTSLPLYRGSVWIDARTWTRVRITMVQLNLSGEILSNEERVDFQPFARESHAPLSAADVARTDPRSILWLPREVSAQQVISAAGRANVVLRSTEFSNFRIDTSEFDELHRQAAASDARIVRDTDKGLRYLEKGKDGQRVVKEGFDNARTFLLGGIHHDAGLQYPVVPLGGIDYFNFDVANRGIQANVFFAGVIVSASATDPDFAHTRTNLGANFFGIAVPFENSMFRNGEEQKGEAVKTLPLNFSVRAGHPFLNFGKVDVSMGISHISYQRSEDTAANYVIPADTFLLQPSIELQYARWGYTLSGYYDYTKRTTWKPWGLAGDYEPNQKSFADFGASFGKSFYLPKFQRIGVEVNYLDGQRLDRFSKYELGFFGSQRIHGVRSGSVRAEKAILAHLSYGFVFSDQFRLEAFYDHGLIDDTTAGYHREPFQGIGLGGQTIGPYGTILRLDLGKTVGANVQSGFVANVVFLKLF